MTRAEGKIALEEHFVTAELESCIAAVGWDAAAWRRVVDRLEDVDGERLEQMDRLGIARADLSLGSDGVQGIADPARAVATARAANDALAEIVARRPDRYVGFAAVAMQDPRAAVEEVERAVRELGFRGVLVNGFRSPTGMSFSAHLVGDKIQGRVVGLISFCAWRLVRALQRSRLCRLYTHSVFCCAKSKILLAIASHRE